MQTIPEREIVTEMDEWVDRGAKNAPTHRDTQTARQQIASMAAYPGEDRTLALDLHGHVVALDGAEDGHLQLLVVVQTLW